MLKKLLVFTMFVVIFQVGIESIMEDTENKPEQETMKITMEENEFYLFYYSHCCKEYEE